MKDRKRPWSNWKTWSIGIALALFIGLRHEVGGDWFTYVDYHKYVNREEGFRIDEIAILGDPGYNIINMLFSSDSWGIYAVNLLGGAIFSAGLVMFCREQTRQWLAICVAIPYLVIVVAMGYTRQGLAIGLMMPGLLALERGRLGPFLALVAAAATFHSTALIQLLFVLPAVPGRSIGGRIIRLLLLVIVGAVLVQTFLVARVEQMIHGYVDAEYQSEGAAIRVMMNMVPGVLLLLLPKRFNLSPQQLGLWRSMAITAIGCAIALLVMPYNSTAIDRVSLYVIPLQIVVGSRLPDTRLLGLKPSQILVSVMSISLAVGIGWLSLGIHARMWLPYKNILFL